MCNPGRIPQGPSRQKLIKKWHISLLIQGMQKDVLPQIVRELYVYGISMLLNMVHEQCMFVLKLCLLSTPSQKIHLPFLVIDHYNNIKEANYVGLAASLLVVFEPWLKNLKPLFMLSKFFPDLLSKLMLLLELTTLPYCELKLFVIVLIQLMIKNVSDWSVISHLCFTSLTSTSFPFVFFLFILLTTTIQPVVRSLFSSLRLLWIKIISPFPSFSAQELVQQK